MTILTQRTQKKSATRSAILQIALEGFSRQGYAGTSTRDIATLAGIHHTLIAYHFGNKDALWKAAIQYLFERQAIELGVGTGTHSLNSRKGRREYARDALRRFVLYCSRYPEHARLMAQECLRDDDPLHWATDNFVTKTAAVALDFIRFLQADNFLPKGAEVPLVYILVGAAERFYTLKPEVQRVWKIDPQSPEMVQAHIDAMLAVFIP